MARTEPARSPSSPRAPREGGLRRAMKAVLRVYFGWYHHIELHGIERVPARGPVLILLNHNSLLDVPALMALDPYPDTVTVVKASLFRVPGLKWLLRQWSAIPVERQGRDIAGVRSVLAALRAGRPLALAAEGRRTRSGRLQPIHPVLAHIAVAARAPIVPVGIIGTFEALPPGAFLPRPHKIVVRVGVPFRLEPGTDPQRAAQRIRDAIAALLPPAQQPLDAQPPADEQDRAG